MRLLLPARHNCSELQTPQQRGRAQFESLAHDDADRRREAAVRGSLVVEALCDRWTRRRPPPTMTTQPCECGRHLTRTARCPTRIDAQLRDHESDVDAEGFLTPLLHCSQFESLQICCPRLLSTQQLTQIVQCFPKLSSLRLRYAVLWSMQPLERARSKLRVFQLRDCSHAKGNMLDGVSLGVTDEQHGCAIG